MDSTGQKNDRRPYYLWHRSTWVFLVLLCLPYGLIALPTATFDDKNERYQSIWLHGWPAIHCAQIEYVGLESKTDALRKLDLDLLNCNDGILRDGKLTDDENDSRQVYWAINNYVHSSTNVIVKNKPKQFWSDGNNWKLLGGNRVSRWFVNGVIINSISFVGMFFIAGVFLDWLRRRKKHWYQITLLEYALLFATIGFITNQVWEKHRIAATQTQAVRDFAACSPNQQTGWTHVEPPVWLERLTNLKFDMNSRGLWTGRLNTQSSSSTVPIPYFTVVDELEFRTVADRDKAISAIEGLKPNYLTATLRQNADDCSADVIRAAKADGVKILALEIPRREDGGVLGVDENFFHNFPDLESMALRGEVRPSHLLAARNTSVTRLTLACNMTPEILDEIAKMQNLELISISIPESLVARFLDQLPHKLRILDMNIAGEKRMGSGMEINLDNLDSFENIEHFEFSTSAGDGNRPNVVLGDFANFPRLRILRIESSFTDATLEDYGLRFNAIPSLTKLTISGFEIDESKTLNWAVSHPKLKRLGIWGSSMPDVQDRIRKIRPDLEAF